MACGRASHLLLPRRWLTVLHRRQADARGNSLGGARIYVQQRPLQIMPAGSQGLEHPLLDAGHGHSAHSCAGVASGFRGM